jgi:hypothetical protein
VASIERGRPGEPELAEDLPPSVDDHRRLEELVSRLSRQLQTLQQNAGQPVRHPVVERDTHMREYSMTLESSLQTNIPICVIMSFYSICL